MKLLQKIVCFLTNAQVLKITAIIVIMSGVGFCFFGIGAFMLHRPDLEQMGMYIGIPAGIYFGLALLFGGPIILDHVEHETSVTTSMWLVWLVKGAAAFLSIFICAFLFAQVANVLDFPRGTWTLLVVVPMTFIYNAIMKGVLKKPIGFVRKYSCS